MSDIKSIRPIKKSSIHNIMKNILSYKYRKTTVKNAKLSEKKFIKFSFFYLKVLLSALIIGLNIIYIDELGFYSHNNNYYTWRLKDEEIFYPRNDNKKINLIIAVSFNKICHYKINESSTGTQEYKLFMEELILKMSEEEKKGSIFVFDNLTSHLTAEMFKFYNNNNLKIICNVPYKSSFNMIELAFRQIKNITYKKLYSSINELKTDLKIIIEGDTIRTLLPKLYRETLNIYKRFIYENEFYNLQEQE